MAVIRILFFLCWTILFVLLCLPLLAVKRGYRPVRVVYWRVVGCFVLKMVVHVRGAPVKNHPFLCVANHASYFDVVALGSLIPGCFVAKKDILGWVGIGHLARVLRAVFVDRRPSSVSHESKRLMDRIHEGETLILFPEGTTSDGNRVLSFKSSLFSIAEREVGGRFLRVQPVSIAYTKQNGLPMGRGARPLYAWYGGMDLVSHLWEAMCAGSFVVEIDFLPPVTVLDCGDRKRLAQYCEKAIRRVFNGVMTGRPVNTKTLVQEDFAISSGP